MQKTLFSAISALCLVFSLNSQNLYHTTYSWEKNPKVYVPKDDEKKADMVIVSEKKLWEVAYDSDGQAMLYETVHNIFHVNSPKAIDNVNKGYMALRNVLEEIDLKARCITAENKVIYYNKATLKKVDNLEGAGPYKIFAIDGVETGCDVEIIYTNKKPFNAYSYYYVQSKSPIVYFEARLISPKNLIFETKSYNGMNSFEKDLSDTTKNHLYLVQKNIVAGEDERYASEKSNYNAFIYQLTYNTDRKKSRIYTWDILSRELYTSVYTLEKGEVKSIAKIVDKNKFAKLKTQEEKIKAFDSFLKTNFEISERYDDISLEQAIDTKKMSNANAVKFYAGALKHMQIPFELCFTTQRDEIKFDSKFPSYIFIKEYLLYFPEVDKYVSPVSMYSRLGFPDYYLLMNDGLFIKEVSIGDIQSSSAKTKSIPQNNYKESYHNTDVVVNLDFNNKTANLNVTHSILGYPTYYVQPIYRYLNQEQKDEIHKNYHLTTNSEGVKNFEVTQTEEADLFVKPMLVKYNVEQNDFLENAGNKFIFKAGLVIGPQAELYEEGKRKWPGDAYYTHYMSRKIEINIPAGYKATNLNDMNSHKSCTVDGKEVAVFKSSYEVKDNKIIITVYEDYQVIEYPLAIYEQFRGVINAAADFNKKNLIFEKI